MGQNRKVGESDYIKITTSVSKEELVLHYNELSQQKLAAHKEHERYLSVYHIIFVSALLVFAFFKEKYYPHDVRWVQWIMEKFQATEFLR